MKRWGAREPNGGTPSGRPRNPPEEAAPPAGILRLALRRGILSAAALTSRAACTGPIITRTGRAGDDDTVEAMAAGHGGRAGPVFIGGASGAGAGGRAGG